jgi:EmrB/QacA subfamily drug resistance transporter
MLRSRNQTTSSGAGNGAPAPSAGDLAPAPAAGNSAPAPAGGIPPELRRLALAIMLGAFMVTLDMTMVNVALNTLARTFATSVTTIQWVATGYLLALAVSIPMTGWAIERFGARASWVASLLMFIAGSVLCGLAWSSTSLIAFRVLQGFGAGMLIPLAQTILAQEAGPNRLGRVMAVVGIPAMLGPVLGPVVGGVIVTDLSWRVMFYINVPVCLAAVAAAYRVAMPGKPAAGNNRPARLDVIGLALLSPGLAAIVYGLAEVGSYGGFTNPHVVVPIAAGAALLVSFAAHALRSRDPIIDLRLFRSHGFSAASALVLLFTMAMLGMQLLLPLYYQQVRHETALDAGLLLAPRGIGMAVALFIAGRLSDRIGPRPIVLVGLLLSAVSTLAYTGIGDHTSLLELSVLLVINGAGLGAALVPSLAAPYRGLRNDQIPRATSAIRILQQLGGSFGVAILAVVLQRELVHQVRHASSLAAAYGQTFWWALAFIALAAIPALMLPRSLPSRQLEPAAATA